MCFPSNQIQIYNSSQSQASKLRPMFSHNSIRSQDPHTHADVTPNPRYPSATPSCSHSSLLILHTLAQYLPQLLQDTCQEHDPIIGIVIHTVWSSESSISAKCNNPFSITVDPLGAPAVSIKQLIGSTP